MASRNIFLTERGFGGKNHGEAVIIAGSKGQALPLRLVITPNGSIGGQLTIVPLLERDPKRSKSDINTEPVVYELKVIRNTASISGGTVRVKIIDCETMVVNMAEIGFSYDPRSGATSFVGGLGLNESEKADELLMGILYPAFCAAMDRAAEYRPGKLFYGLQASNVPPIKREWFNKVTGTTQANKPVRVQEEVAVEA